MAAPKTAPKTGAREFFGCYLLESHHPKARGRSYVGFTVNPRRRIRQHNGEISNGANKTKAYRPWEMVLVVYGFPTQVQALQFEWSWQHPEKSLDIRSVAARLGKKARYGVRGKVLLLMEMLRTEPWCYYPLTLQFLSSRVSAERGRCPPPPPHMPVLVAPLEALPEVVEDQVDPAEEEEAEESEEDGEEQGGGANSSGSDADGEEDALPSQQLAGSGGGWDDVGDLRQRLAARGGAAADASSELASGSTAAAAAGARAAAVPLVQERDAGGEPAGAAAGGAKRGKGKAAAARSAAAAARTASACAVCSKAASRTWFTCGGCGSRCHVECLARHLLEADSVGASLPTRGQCPSCSKPLVWMEVLSGLENAGWEKHKKRGGKAGRGSKAAAAAASQPEGSSRPSSPSGAVAAAGRVKGKGGRGRKAAAAASAQPGSTAGAAAVDATDAASGVAEGGKGAAAARGSRARGKKGTAAVGALGAPSADEDGAANLAGSAAVAAAAGAEPTRRRGRPRKAALPAFPPGGLFAGDSLQGGSPAAPQQGQQRWRRQQQPGPAAQAQPARQVWAAAAAEPLEVLEAATPWDDFDLTGSEPAVAYMQPGAYVPSPPPSFSPGQPALMGTSWGNDGVAAPAGAQTSGRNGRLAAGGHLQRAAASAEVVVLSDSDSDGGLGSPLLPLAQRLQQQRRQQCTVAGQREGCVAGATSGEGRGTQLWEPWGQPAVPPPQQLQGQLWSPAEHSPQSCSPASGAGAAVGPGRWDSPPTHRLGTFQLASLPASPASHRSQPSQQQQQQLCQHRDDSSTGVTASSPSQPCPMAIDSSLPALGVAPAQGASPSHSGPAAQRSLAWEPAAPRGTASPGPGSIQRQLGPALLPGDAGAAVQRQQQTLLGSGSGIEVVDLVGQEAEAGPAPAWGFQQQRHRRQRQQQEQEQEQEQGVGHGQVEVVELISPSPLPLRERLQQGPQSSGGRALAGSAAGAPLGAKPPRAAGHSAQSSQGQQLAATVGAGQQLAGSASDDALRGEEMPRVEDMAVAQPRRIRGYSRGRRIEPKPSAETSALGPSRPAAKTRSLASPRGTPSPAPLRKRVQQQQQQEGGTGNVTAGPGWAHALEDCSARLQGSFDASQAQQQQQQDTVAQGFTGGGKVPADSEDDVIVISD